ncbi:hypothetical protein POPTR_005G123850v4 [Populus trichocarpa]|uniref:Uncharacterized protein n=1 Tax=Populus trichocarpa TaxID=3694 RepID=A0ACC0T052_POPTR|nr:hypothetical protein POPTR_005G123850v4 [Populus trichocarpa]
MSRALLLLPLFYLSQRCWMLLTYGDCCFPSSFAVIQDSPKPLCCHAPLPSNNPFSVMQPSQDQDEDG